MRTRYPDRMVKPKSEIAVEAFSAVDMRVGVVLEVRAFPEARKPAWQIHVDFGPELGTVQTDGSVVLLDVDDSAELGTSIA